MQARIYKPWRCDGSELCQPIRDEDFRTIGLTINGDRRAGSWRPIAMRLIAHEDGRSLAFADSPWLGGHALLLRPQAIEAMEPLLSQNGEILPLICEGGEISVFNPVRLDEALDEDASLAKRISGRRVMIIAHHVFRPHVITGVDAFKIRNGGASSTFVSEAFVTRWRNAGLRGIAFKQVWPHD